MGERAGQRRRASERHRRVTGRRTGRPVEPGETCGRVVPEPAAGPVTCGRAPYGLTVADVVPRGAVVGVDESRLVHTLLGAVVAAGPALVGTTSLAAVCALVDTRQAADRELVVRLFGGDLRPAAGAFTGPRGVQAVTDTACDVALVAGRLVDDTVWVPADVRPERLALVLAARRAYLVLGDRPDPTVVSARPWAPLGPLAGFDGVLEVPAPDDAHDPAPHDGPAAPDPAPHEASAAPDDDPGHRPSHAA